MLTDKSKRAVDDISTRVMRLDSTNQIITSTAIDVLLTRQRLDEAARKKPPNGTDKKSA